MRGRGIRSGVTSLRTLVIPVMQPTSSQVLPPHSEAWGGSDIWVGDPIGAANSLMFGSLV